MNKNTIYFVTDYITKRYGFEAALVFGHIAFWCVKDKFDGSPQAIATVLGISKNTAKKYRNLFVKLGYFSVIKSQYEDGKALVFNFDATDLDAHKLFETYQTAFGSGSKPDNGIALIEVDLSELPKNMTNHHASYLRGLLIFKAYLRDKLAAGKASNNEKYNAISYVKLGLELGLHAKTIAKYVAYLVKKKCIQVLRNGKLVEKITQWCNGKLTIMTAKNLASAVIAKSKRFTDKILADKNNAKQSFYQKYKTKPT